MLSTILVWLENRIAFNDPRFGIEYALRLRQMALSLADTLDADCCVIDLAAPLFLIYRYPAVTTHAEDLGSFLAQHDIPLITIKRVIAVLEEVKSHNAISAEALAIHDAHYLDKLGYTGLARSLTTAKYRMTTTLQQIRQQSAVTLQRLKTPMGLKLGSQRLQAMGEFMRAMGSVNVVRL